MSKLFTSDLLKKLRNNVPIIILISNILEIPSKSSENYFRFLCPICREFNTSANLKTNLGRCFNCGKNFNPIDMVMTYRKCDFIEAVQFLIPHLEKFAELYNLS